MGWLLLAVLLGPPREQQTVKQTGVPAGGGVDKSQTVVAAPPQWFLGSQPHCSSETLSIRAFHRVGSPQVGAASAVLPVQILEYN